MARVTQASGLIPQIGVVVGNTEGIAAFAPTLSDVLIITQELPSTRQRRTSLARKQRPSAAPPCTLQLAPLTSSRSPTPRP